MTALKLVQHATSYQHGSSHCEPSTSKFMEALAQKSSDHCSCPGPLIRILGDRFPWEMKAAILNTLGLLIGKGGVALKPFVPQLQTTFLKCLADQVHTQAQTGQLDSEA